MILNIFIFITGLNVALAGNFFRRDYNYNKERDAFYKVVWSEAGSSFDTAYMSCDDDGSFLFYPKDEDEWEIINNLVEALPIRPNTSDVLLGIRDEVGNGQFLTVDGQIVSSYIEQDALFPLDCVVMDVNTGTLISTLCKDEYHPRLFVCKKIDSSPCPTADKDYKYYKDLKRCYKVNLRKKSWKDAMKTCYMEGGLLVVVESDEEANIINEMLPYSPEEKQKFYSGVRQISGKFFTLKGKKLEDSFSRWYKNDPEGEEQYYENLNNQEEPSSSLSSRTGPKVLGVSFDL